MSDSETESYEESSEEETPEERIAAANEIKLRGNEAFKNKDYQSAKELYEEAIERLDDAKPDLEAALHNNASAACLAMNEFFEAIRHAEEVLYLEPDNEKALYRAAQSKLMCGYPVEAKQLAAKLLKLKPTSGDARRIIKEAHAKIVASEKKQKQAFRGLFDKTAGMYEDINKKQMDKKREKYEKAMKLRKEKGLEVVDMKTWENELIQRKQAKKEYVESVATAETTDTSTLSSQPSKADDFDEEDKKIIDETRKMGYCYFKEHADNVERQLKSFHLHKTSSATPEHEPEVSEPKENKALSSWNAQATTYEEKDVSKWALEAFDYYIRGTKADNNCKATITILNINDLDGNANISVIRGTKRYMFEFTCSIDLNIKFAENEQYKVKLHMNDISSELVTGETWKDEMTYSLTSLDKSIRPKVSESIDLFEELICTSISTFFDRFKQLN